MAYERNDILESEKAYRICSILWEEASYGAKISRQLEGNSEHKAESTRNFLRVLNNAGIISVIDDNSLKITDDEGNVKKDLSSGNKKYYSVDIEGLYNYWFEEIRKGLKQRLIQSGIDKNKLTDKENINKLIKELEDTANKFQEEDNLKTHGKAHREIKLLEFILWTYNMTPDHGGKLKPFFRSYATTHLNLNKQGNFRKMLFEDISAGLNSSDLMDSEEEISNHNPEFWKLSEVLTILIGNPKGIKAVKTAIKSSLNSSNI